MKYKIILIVFIKKRLGYFCASYPVLVLTFGGLLCCVCMGGFFFFDVITDPVELWSPVDSNTRLNKDYFDTHFRPFYRTTQLIVRPTDTTPWGHYLFCDGCQTVQYSSTLQQDFLLQVLDLQNKVKSLKGTLNIGNRTETVSLDDICFKPLTPDNNNCTIQSIFEYWQSDVPTFLTVI